MYLGAIAPVGPAGGANSSRAFGIVFKSRALATAFFIAPEGNPSRIFTYALAMAFFMPPDGESFCILPNGIKQGT